MRTPFSFSLDIEDRKRLEDIAREKKISQAKYIREAVAKQMEADQKRKGT